LDEFLKRQEAIEGRKGTIPELPSAEGPKGAIPAEVERFVHERARGEDLRRGIDYLTQVQQKLGTNFVIGRSRTRATGQTNYIRVHGDGPQLRSTASSAVAYFKPRQGVIDLRLLPQDVKDINDARIEQLQRKGSSRPRPYQVRCRLDDDAAVDLAIELTKRAIDKLSQ
jgi:hypothetical protein